MFWTSASLVLQSEERASNLIRKDWNLRQSHCLRMGSPTLYGVAAGPRALVSAGRQAPPGATLCLEKEPCLLSPKKRRFGPTRPGIHIKGILHAYISSLGDKLSCFWLPWFLVSLATPRCGVGGHREVREKEESENDGANCKDPEQRGWRCQGFFFPREKGQKAWMDVSWQRRWLCFCALWCFVIQKWKQCATKLITSESL